MPSRPPALRMRRALSAPASSVSRCPSTTRCPMPNCGPYSMLAHSNCSAGTDGVLDPLGGAAVAGHFQAVIVGGGDDGVHLVKGHAQGVVVVGIGGGGVAGGVGLDPLDAVLDESAHRG